MQMDQRSHTFVAANLVSCDRVRGKQTFRLGLVNRHSQDGYCGQLIAIGIVVGNAESPWLAALCLSAAFSVG